MKKIKIYTHDGKFHADETLAIALIKHCHPDADVEIIRSRTLPTNLERESWIIDVGGVYDPITKRFDHHMPEGAGERLNGTPYASAGIVMKYLASGGWESPEFWTRMDRVLVEGVDAGDCGYDSPRSEKGIRYLTLNGIIAGFNNWGDLHGLAQRNSFESAVYFMAELVYRTSRCVKDWLLDQERVNSAFAELDGAVMILDAHAMWQEHLAAIDTAGAVEFVVFWNEKIWMVQTVPETLGSFKPKVPLPENWAGLNGKELDILAGTNDAVFCHRNGFLAGFASRESAVEAAKLASKMAAASIV